jgi:hypothetical protein
MLQERPDKQQGWLNQDLAHQVHLPVKAKTGKKEVFE